MRKLLAILLTFLFVQLSAQTQDAVRISGRVTSTSGDPLEACIVAVLHPADSSIVAYSMTDEVGRYSTEFALKSNEMLLRLTGFNVKRIVKRVSARTQTIDLKAEEESIALREVQVKAQKLWGSRDTLNYLVSAYMKDHDRTIGDVLKQLPGITIDGGVIKYQGIAINHFYIENMDVLQGRYNIATEGIRAEDVATVQVLENHEHVKALQDQVPPESAAINLKLKEKAKGLWTKSADLGLGYDDALLWDNSINVMYFGKRRQHVLHYGNENTGSTSDIAAQHYGGSGLGASVLTGIMSAGSSPIGNSLRNNRHSVNLNNLSKLSDTKQFHYNLSYKHDAQRRSSHSQTTYILPDADVRIMSEDISERHTLNDAHVELEYEDNADKHFLSNKLELAGQWTDGNGTVASNGSNIDQHSYNRNLGLQNRTRWVRRTKKGGGFELNSTNIVQTTPQELSVSGGMEARQEVDITRVSTSNDFALLKDLRRNRWTIVPSAGLDVNYVGLKSVLKAQTSDNGAMDYVRAQGGVGAILRYVKNEFRMTFNLPLSLTHTNVIGETNVTRLRISPSVSMLWKATDSWTLSSDAGYGTNETPWSQLITCYIMSNYRTVSRYVANLSDSQRLYANLKLNYKDILNEFFAYIQGSASRSWSDIVYGTTVDESAHTIIQAVNMPNSSNNYGLTANVSKGIDWHAAKVEATASFRRNESMTLRQGVKTNFNNNTYSVNGNIAVNIVKPVRLTYNCGWSMTRTNSQAYSQSIKCFNQSTNLNISFIPNRLLMSLSARHTHNSGLQGKRDYAFMDASLTLRTKSKQEFVLSVDNIFNTRTFVSRGNNDMTEYFSVYNLRPRSVMVSTHLKL